MSQFENQVYKLYLLDVGRGVQKKNTQKKYTTLTPPLPSLAGRKKYFRTTSFFFFKAFLGTVFSTLCPRPCASFDTATCITARRAHAFDRL